MTKRSTARSPQNPGRRGGGASSAAQLVAGRRSATTRPRLSTTPRSATDSALRAFCSTSRTVSPVLVAQLAQQRHDLRGDARRQPERRLVEQQQPRAGPSAPGRSTSICRSPPDSVVRRLRCGARASAREQLVDLGEAAARRRSPRHSPPSRRFSSTVSSAITPRPSGTWAMPAPDDAARPAQPRRARARRARSGRPRGRTSPESVRSRDRLAGAVGAQHGGDARPAATSKVTPSSARDRAVARVTERRSTPRASRPSTPRGRRRARAGRPGTSAGVPVGDAAAEVEHDDAVAHAHHEVHVVLDEQHRECRPLSARGPARPARRCRRAPRPPAGSSSRSSSGSRDERPGERDALLDARRAASPGSGRRPRRRRARRAASCAARAARRSSRSERGSPSSADASRRAGCARRRPSRSRGRSARANRPTPCSVRAMPSPASCVRPQPRSGPPRQRDVPASGRDEPADDVEQRGLAGAVGADDADDLARARPSSETSSSAVSPPKRTVTPSTRSPSPSSPCRRSRRSVRTPWPGPPRPAAAWRHGMRRRGAPHRGERAKLGGSAF